MKTVFLPTFSVQELNDAATRAGVEKRNSVEIEKTEMAANIDAFNKSLDGGDAIFLCLRKDLGNGNFQYAMISTPLNEDIEVDMSPFKFSHNIIMSADRKIVSILKRILNNLAFM